MWTQGQPFDRSNHPAPDLSQPDTKAGGFALKAYGEVQVGASAGVIGPEAGHRFTRFGLDAPAFGLWLDYGG